MAIKVVLICGFSNKEVQKHINPLRPAKEHGLFIPSLLQLFEHRDDIQLHVISTHSYIHKTKSFILRGICYYFIPRGIPIIGRSWPGFFPADVWVDYFDIKLRVRRIINRIKPDIIHLHGAENTYHTPAIIQFHNKIPVLVTIQGFVSKSSSNTLRVRRRKKRELHILEDFRHFTFALVPDKNEVLKHNPKANTYLHRYRRSLDFSMVKDQQNDADYDLVFFAKVTKEKGIEDFLKAVCLLKKTRPSINAIIIGSCNSSYQLTLDYLVNEYNIKENVKFVGFLPTINDVHKLAVQAKVSVLPTYNDAFSGTIAESMFLKIPVVAYATGGIPEANTEETTISLVPKGEVHKLANEIARLLDNNQLRKTRADRAHKWFLQINASDDAADNLKCIYKKVIQYERDRNITD